MRGAHLLMYGDNPSLALTLRQWANENHYSFDVLEEVGRLSRFAPNSVLVWAPGEEERTISDELAKIASKHRSLVCVPHKELKFARKALDSGFVSYLCIPANELVVFDHLNALSRPPDGSEMAAPRIEPSEIDRLGKEFSDSESGRRILGNVETVAPFPTTVLLLGESGTGKEVVAKLIHQLSPRFKGPFIPVHLAAMQRDLIESELFGHVQGAFTGALRDRKGAFALAHGGTLFLDEIGEVPLDIQAKILRVIQDREYVPVGGESSQRSNCRIIAATNRDLVADVGDGRFRKDLYFRLSVFPIILPPLRERTEELAHLVSRLLTSLNRKLGTNIEGVSAEVLEALRAHDWPGNIRELENALERASVVRKHGTMEASDILLSNVSAPPSADVIVDLVVRRDHLGSGFQIDDVLVRLEGAILKKAMEIAGGNMAQAARLVGLARSTLQSRLAKHQGGDN